MLREHKPPPNTAIRRIRISDFALLDSDRDPHRHQNCITWSLSHALPYKKFRQNPFTSLRVIRRTDRQTDRTENITSFFGGGNNWDCNEETSQTMMSKRELETWSSPNDMRTHTGSTFDWPFDLKVNACRLTTMHCVSTKFDRSNLWEHGQTDRQTDTHTVTDVTDYTWLGHH